MKYIFLVIWLMLWWCKLLIFDIIGFIWDFKLYHFRRCDNYLGKIYSPRFGDNQDQDVIYSSTGKYPNAYIAVFYYVFN